MTESIEIDYELFDGDWPDRVEFALPDGSAQTYEVVSDD